MRLVIRKIPYIQRVSVEIFRNVDGVVPKALSFDLESANRFSARNRGWCLISGVASGLPAEARGIGGGMSRETDGVMRI